MISLIDHDSVRVLTICREKRRNSLDEETVMKMRELIAKANSDQTIRALVITGEGEIAFCAGSDMKAAQEMTVDQRIEHAQHGQQLMDEIFELDLLTIAAVEGYALGGGLELALSCDLVISGESGLFGLPEVQRSAVPSWGGTYRVTKAVGLSVAKNMLLGGKYYSSHEAAQVGLVYEVVQTGQAKDRAIELAKEISDKSDRQILAQAKDLLNRGAYRSPSESRSAEFEVEKRLTAGESYGNLL